MNSFLYSLLETTKAFFYSPGTTSKKAPYVHDPIDIKRVMIIVVVALLPAAFFAIINSGVHAILYDNVNIGLMEKYLTASESLKGYFSFVLQYFPTIFLAGLKLFLPQILLIYLVGGVIEIFFASLHRKTVSEGFLVTGILFALILPPTLPYWMTIFGVSTGLILGKELFGGTGMNIFNPALICRCILYFSFPSYMTGNVWVGENSFNTTKNVARYNNVLRKNSFDTITTATPLNIAELPKTVTRLQIDALALTFTKEVRLKKELSQKLTSYNAALSLNTLTPEQIIDFTTKGLGLKTEQLESAFHFAKLAYNIAPYNDANLYFGNIPGSFGETSKCAVHIGMILLVLTGIISLRIIFPAMLAALFTAACFYYATIDNPSAPAAFALLPYKQLIMGGLSFGIVFMATDPVSAPTTKSAQIIYATLIGALTIIIRIINPAFPEGVMLAILFANAFSPLLDRIALRYRRRGIHGKVIIGKGGI
ncbi:NADH:ubiquinone reductase (Na(+)-transporting) subunit B [bacterium]|nr:NADH:ubiquinone reductase (Na(+)-transporting) subunit B [bacterium]